MAKKTKTAQESSNAHVALHEIHYHDPDFGPSVVSVGDEIPDGLFDEDQLARLVGKRAVRPPAGSAPVARPEATGADLDAVTGQGDDSDGLGDDGGDAATGKTTAATPGPAVKSKKKK